MGAREVARSRAGVHAVKAFAAVALLACNPWPVRVVGDTAEQVCDGNDMPAACAEKVLRATCSDPLATSDATDTAEIVARHGIHLTVPAACERYRKPR